MSRRCHAGRADARIDWTPEDCIGHLCALSGLVGVLGGRPRTAKNGVHETSRRVARLTDDPTRALGP